MAKLVAALVSTYHWSMRARWRTWLFHSLFGLIISGLFGVAAAVATFLFREIEQYLKKKFLTHEPNDALDNMLDFAVVFYVVGIASLFGWGV